MKILGITDERDGCDCCGKSGLKRVVALQNENGEITFMGTTCATRKHKIASKTKIDFMQKVFDRTKNVCSASELKRVLSATVARDHSEWFNRCAKVLGKTWTI